VIDTIYVASVYDGVYIEHMEATPMTVNAIDIEVRKPTWVEERVEDAGLNEDADRASTLAASDYVEITA
jgi:hypothetical protein